MGLRYVCVLLLGARLCISCRYVSVNSMICSVVCCLTENSTTVVVVVVSGVSQKTESERESEWVRVGVLWAWVCLCVLGRVYNIRYIYFVVDIVHVDVVRTCATLSGSPSARSRSVEIILSRTHDIVSHLFLHVCVCVCFSVHYNYNKFALSYKLAMIYLINLYIMFCKFYIVYIYVIYIICMCVCVKYTNVPHSFACLFVCVCVFSKNNIIPTTRKEKKNHSKLISYAIFERASSQFTVS